MVQTLLISLFGLFLAWEIGTSALGYWSYFWGGWDALTVTLVCACFCIFPIMARDLLRNRDP